MLVSSRRPGDSTTTTQTVGWGNAMRIRGLFVGTAVSLSWCTLASTSVPARGGRDAGGDSSSRPEAYLEEIIVTAQKREERLIDVPAPITAVTADDISARGA